MNKSIKSTQLEPKSTNKARGLYLQRLRNKKGWTQVDLAEALGRSKGMISGYENGRGISLHVLKKMSELFDVSEGDILNAGMSVNEPVKQYGKFNLNAAPGLKVMMVPLVSQYAYAGYLSGWSDEEYLEELPRLPFMIEEERNFKGNYKAFEVRGDSMFDGSEDSYKQGVKLIGREIPRHYWSNKFHYTQWKAFIVVHRTDGILVKRMIGHDVEKGIITLHSLNDIYEDFEVHLDDCIQIFNVIASHRDERN